MRGGPDVRHGGGAGAQRGAAGGQPQRARHRARFDCTIQCTLPRQYDTVLLSKVTIEGSSHRENSSTDIFLLSSLIPTEKGMRARFKGHRLPTYVSPHTDAVRMWTSVGSETTDDDVLWRMLTIRSL